MTRKARKLKIERVIPGTDVVMEGFHTPHKRAPKKKPYRFDSQLVQEVAIAVKLGMNCLFAGPTGCGKTSLPIQIAAQLGIPCVRFNMDGETRVTHIRGAQKPAAKDGVLTLVFVLGMLAQAMREGWWVVLDEIDAAMPSVLFVLQSVLEEGNRALRIPETGEVIEAHPDFHVFATSNTIGYRSYKRAHHAGTNMMNTAFVDRFGMIIAVDYPPKEEEIERIRVHVPQLASGFLYASHDEDGGVIEVNVGSAMIDGIARVAEELRRAERFRADFSTRRCIQWARLAEQFHNTAWKPEAPQGNLPFDMLRAANLSVLRKLDTATDMKVAKEMIQRVFAYEEG